MKWFRALKEKKVLRKRIIVAVGTLLIFAGLTMIGWPVYLKIQADAEQRQLDDVFYSHNPNLPSELEFHRGVEREPEEEPDTGPQWERVFIDSYTYDQFPPTKIVIPKLDVEANVITVTNLDVYSRRLNFPPGYYPESAYPGQKGNIMIAGHRDGPAGYFLRVNRLVAGDIILLQTPDVTFEFEVEWIKVVEPTDWSALQPTNYHALTLQTCQREGTDTSALRLIVRARMSRIWYWQEVVEEEEAD